MEMLAPWLAAIWAALVSIGWQTALIFYDSAPFILAGCFVAGLLHAYISGDFIVRYMGGNDFRSVAWAAVLGAPVPLCSCSVLPTAIALHKKGASKPAVASFLISVPETDVENVAITYGLMGPVMAVYRPIAGIVTAIAAGMLTILFRDKNETPVVEDAAAVDACCAPGQQHHHDHDHHHHHDHEAPAAPPSGTKLSTALRFGFVELFDEIAFWITFGLIITGVMLGLLPSDFFARVGLDSGIVPMLLMVAISVPLYTCASMSAPMGAGLIATGLSPGAALVYLLCGPATSLATLPIIGRLMGARLLAAYLIALIGVAILAGLVLDWLAADLVREAVRAGREEPDTPAWAAIKIAATVVFVGLIVNSFRRGALRHGFADLSRNLGHLRVVVPAVRDAFNALGGRQLIAHTENWDWLRLRKAALVLAGSAAVAALLPAFFLVVDVGQQGLIQRFGKVVERDLAPGLYVHLPPPFGRGIAVDAGAVQQITVTAGTIDGGRGYFLTSDENVIDLQAAVQYRTSDAYKATFAVTSPADMVAAASRQVLVELAMTMPIDRIYNVGRAALEEEFGRRLADRVRALDFGHEVVAAHLMYVHAPSDVHATFRDVASSIEDRARAIFDADGDAALAIAKAGGQAADTLSKAGADSVAAVKNAEGRTAPFAELAKVHAESRRITEQRLLLETVERTLGAPRKYLNGAALPDSAVDLWLESGREPVMKFRFKE